MASKTTVSSERPWWLFFLGAIGLILGVWIFLNDLYTEVFNIVIQGAGITLSVALIAFSLASLLGLLIAVMSLSDKLLLRQIARFYVEVIRGLPILVLLFYIAFVAAPAMIYLLNLLLSPLIKAGLIEAFVIRDFSLFWRAVIALTIGYSAFIAEVFRSGIQSVDKGQIEAASALGLSRWQRFRFIVMPQALRTIMPALGNDFIAIIKDSSLVSVLGVADITQMGKIYASGSFRFFETYSIVAYIYLFMTVSLSLILRRIEKHLRQSVAIH